MKFSISNLAWNKSENKKVINFIKKKNISNLEYSFDILKENHPKENFKEYYLKKKLNYTRCNLFYLA